MLSLHFAPGREFTFLNTATIDTSVRWRCIYWVIKRISFSTWLRSQKIVQHTRKIRKTDLLQVVIDAGAGLIDFNNPA